ncbi:MAG: hypothetical protein NTZ39_09175 [Methanoregula sp.]|nr:hypothetical protein [Methanoregula sp.]
MTDEISTRFKSELSSFYLLVLLNLVFGALAMAFGIQFVIASVLGLTGGQTTPEFRMITGVFSMVCFGLGISWVLSSAKILKGITGIRREFRHRTATATDETVTRGIVRMVAHYRENQKTIRTMILVCTLGGFCFLALGIMNSMEFFSGGFSSGRFVLNSYLLIPSALLTLAIALVSLLSSYYFLHFSRTWDLRQQETAKSEDILKKSMGIDKE